MENYIESKIPLLPIKELKKIDKGRIKKILIELDKTSRADEYMYYEKLLDVLLKVFNKQEDYHEMIDEKREFENILKEINSRFSIIMNEINNLGYESKKLLFENYYNNIFINLKDISNNIYSNFKKRDNLKKIDYLFYTYINLLVNFFRYIADNIKDLNENEFKDYLDFYTVASMNYLIIIYAYYKNKVNESMLLDKISELNTHIRSYTHKRSGKVNKLLDETKDTYID